MATATHSQIKATATVNKQFAIVKSTLAGQSFIRCAVGICAFSGMQRSTAACAEHFERANMTTHIADDAASDHRQCETFTPSAHLPPKLTSRTSAPDQKSNSTCKPITLILDLIT